MTLGSQLRGCKGLLSRWLTAVLLTGLMAVGLLGAGYAPAVVSGFSRRVWLASSVGEVARLDGSSADVMARVRLASTGTGLQVAPLGEDAVVVDRASGTVGRLSAATLAAGPRVPALPRTSSDLTVLTGGGAVWAVDTAAGTAASLDPTTLAPRSGLRSLPVGASTDAVVVDGSGRLWVYDPNLGVLASGGSPGQQRDLGSRGAATLSVVGGRIVALDAAGSARTVDPSSAGPGTVTAVGVSARNAVLARTSARWLVVADSSRGRLVLTGLADGTRAEIPLTSASAVRSVAFGAPVELSGRAFVPELATGTVFVVDEASASVVKAVRIPGGGSPSLEVVARDDVVFYNDPASERAGVIRLDGSSTAVAKYRPAGRSGQGPAKPGSATPAPGQSGPAPARSSDAKVAELSIVLSTAEPVVGQQVGLAARMADGRLPRRAQWSFGDGASATGPAGLTHVWATAGQYRVFVTAITPAGTTLSATRWVTVSPPGGRTGQGSTGGGSTGGGGNTGGGGQSATHTVTVTDGGGGRITAVAAGQSQDCTTSPCTFAVTTPAQVDLTAAADTGYQLTSWGTADCPATATRCSFTATGNQAVTITFASTAPAGHTVTVTRPVGGSITALPDGGTSTDCTSGCSLPVADGQGVALTATPAAAYRLTNWGVAGCPVSSTSCRVTVTANRTITVTFAQATLSISRPTISGDGVQSCPASVTVRSTIRTDTPGTVTYTWSGDVTPQGGSLTFAAAGSQTVTGRISFPASGSMTVALSADLSSRVFFDSLPATASVTCQDTTPPQLTFTIAGTTAPDTIAFSTGASLPVSATATDGQSQVTSTVITYSYDLSCQTGVSSSVTRSFSGTVVQSGDGSASASWASATCDDIATPHGPGMGSGTMTATSVSAGGTTTRTMQLGLID